jgi:hypothetical protein
MKRAKLTVNTTLIAQDGALVAWAVNSPEFLIEVPWVEPSSKKAVGAPVAAASTNAPAPVTNTLAQSVPASALNTNAAPPKPRQNIAPIIITKATVAKEKREYTAMTTTFTNEAAAFASETNDELAVSNLIDGAAALIPIDVPVVTTATNALSASKPPQIAVAAPFSKPSSAALTNGAGTVQSSKSKISDSTTPAPVAVPPVVSAVRISDVPTQSTYEFHPVLWIGIGAAAALVCVFAGVLILRCRRQDPSLISQAIAQQRIRLS